MTDWIKTNKMYFLIGALIISALAIYYVVPSEKESTTEIENDWVESEEAPLMTEKNKDENLIEQEEIIVDVKGAVSSPGVYDVQTGDRVIDVIERAGGLLQNADQNQINFAMKVTDEMVLYIPIAGEQNDADQSAPVGVAAGISSAQGDKVNLNRASESDLQTLTGVGPAKAAAIIEYRESNGPFKKIEELMEISGIGEKTFEKLKDSITVN